MGSFLETKRKQEKSLMKKRQNHTKVIEVRFTAGIKQQGLFVFPLRTHLFEAAALRKQ